MDATELLKTWPGWANANAARVFASPAWRMGVQWNGEQATLVHGESLPAEAISLDIVLADAPNVLTLAPNPQTPDLWMMREKLSLLPPEVVLALVEKECGPLFQLFEDLFHASFAVRGVSAARAEGSVFRLEAGSDPILFSLNVTPALELPLGGTANLDPTHESIRALSREAFVRHATLSVSDEEIAALQVGDLLLAPEGLSAEWTVEPPEGVEIQVLSPEKGELTFAQMADDALPPVPETSTYVLRRGEKTLATAELSKVGLAPALKILTI